jgi:hypothetical protein
MKSSPNITPKKKDAEGKIQSNIRAGQCHQSRVPTCVHLGLAIDDCIEIAALFHEDEHG